MDPLTVCGIMKNSNCSHARMPPPPKKNFKKIQTNEIHIEKLT